MAYLPKTLVEKNIRARVRTGPDGKPRTDYEAYLGVNVFTGRPVRITRNDITSLKKDLVDFYARLRIGGDAGVALGADEAVDARHAVRIIKGAKLDKSLTEIVKEYLSGDLAKSRATVDDINIEDAFRKYYQSFGAGTHKDFIRRCTGKWVEQNMGRKLSSFTADEIEKYLADNFSGNSPKTYNTNLVYIKIFLSWCADETRRYVAENPIRKMKKKPEPWEEPEYMSPDGVEALFRAVESHRDVRPDMLAYIILNFFCGMRGVEITRVTGGDRAVTVNLDDETVRVTKVKGFQKGRRPRAFHIEPTALAWMKSFDFARGLANINEYTRGDVYDLAKKRRIPKFQNCGRHTFITYHVAAFGDPAKTQAMVGTGDRMRAENYCGLACRADANAFFSILPLSESEFKEGDHRELKHMTMGPRRRYGKLKKVYMFDEKYEEYLKQLEEAERPKAPAPEDDDGDGLGFELEIC